MAGQVKGLDAMPHKGPKIFSDGEDHGWGQKSLNRTEALAPDASFGFFSRAHEIGRLLADDVIEVPHESLDLYPGARLRDSRAHLRNYFLGTRHRMYSLHGRGGLPPP